MVGKDPAVATSLGSFSLQASWRILFRCAFSRLLLLNRRGMQQLSVTVVQESEILFFVCVPPKSQTENERGTFGFCFSFDDERAIAASERGKGSTVRSIPSVERVSPDTCVSSSPSRFFPSFPSLPRVNSAVVALPIVPNPFIVALRFLTPPVRWAFRARSKLVFPTFSAVGPDIKLRILVEMHRYIGQEES